MTLSNFFKENKNKLKQAQKLKVRDIDKIEKNTYVAYVDEANESYDVQIEFDAKKNIKTTQCDCATGGVCIHIVALALFISENKTEKTIVKKGINKKLSETDQILETIDNDTLRIWVSEILNNNKEIAFLFKNKFSTQQISFDKNYLKKNINESIASIIGKRRTIETNEVKKIVDALTVSLKPILDYVYTIPITEKKYEIYTTLLSEIESINYNYYITSIKFTRFIETIENNLLKALFNIRDIEVWTKSIMYYFSCLFKNEISSIDLELCKKIYAFSTTNEMQKKIIANYIVENVNQIYTKSGLEYFNFSYEMEVFFFKVYTENNLFENNYLKFRPRHYRNEYNIDLIKQLLAINKTEFAEKYCIEQININVKKDYDMPYVDFLITIYKKKEDIKKLVNLLSIYGKYLYDIEYYNLIKENCTIQDFKKYRLAVMPNARNQYQKGNIKAFDFYFEIKKQDNKVADLFEMFKNCYNLTMIDKYKEIALQIDEEKFILTLSSFSFFYSQNQEILDNIVNFTVKKIDKKKLQCYLKNIPRYNFNRIILKIQEKINA